MHRFFQHLGIRRSLLRIESDGGEAGNEHDLEIGLQLGGALGHFDAIGARHDDIGQQQVVGALVERQNSRVAIGATDNIIAGALQGARQKAADGILIFGKENFLHRIGHVKPQAPHNMRLGAEVIMFAGGM